MNPGDLEMFNKFLPSEPDPLIQEVGQEEGTSGQGINLADLILEKIAAHEATQAGKPKIQGGGLPEDAVEIPAKAVEVFSKYVGVIWNRFVLPIYWLLRIPTELDYFYHDTSPVNFPNRSRFFPPSRNGRNFFQSQDRHLGQQMHATKQPEYSSPQHHT